MKRKRILYLIICLTIAFGLVFPLASSVYAEDAPVKIDINKATADELTEIKGIGTELASRIVSYRETNGPFKSINDLTKVKGIGEKKLEKIKDQIVVSNEKESNKPETPPVE